MLEDERVGPGLNRRSGVAKFGKTALWSFACNRFL